MRVVFMGTPEFGVPVFNAVLNSRHELIAAVCQPDRAGNRCALVKPPVKVCAEAHAVPVLQFERVSRGGADMLRSLKPDIMVTAAFGQILSDEILKIAPKGVINVHASLLPKYRGSAPINYALMEGEKTTGITIMQTAKAVDSGDIIMQEPLNILPEETAGELTERLSKLGAEMIVKALDAIEDGRAVWTPQDHSKATLCPMLTKDSGRIGFNVTARRFVDTVRALDPWPNVYAEINGIQLKILKAEIAEGSGEPGTVLEASPKTGLKVAVSDGAVRLIIVQPQGKKAMSGKDFVMGYRIEKGMRLC